MTEPIVPCDKLDLQQSFNALTFPYLHPPKYHRIEHNSWFPTTCNQYTLNRTQTTITTHCATRPEESPKPRLWAHPSKLVVFDLEFNVEGSFPDPERAPSASAINQHLCLNPPVNVTHPLSVVTSPTSPDIPCVVLIRRSPDESIHRPGNTKGRGRGKETREMHRAAKNQQKWDRATKGSGFRFLTDSGWKMTLVPKSGKHASAHLE